MQNPLRKGREERAKLTFFHKLQSSPEVRNQPEKSVLTIPAKLSQTQSIVDILDVITIHIVYYTTTTIKERT